MGQRILIVEDNKPQAEAATKLLRAEGYEVEWAADGKSAIKLAASGGYDLVMLDVVLPDMQGTQICQWLKSNASTRRTPVVMVTAKDSVEDMVTSLEAGADDYIHKPYVEVELKARIKAHLRTKALQDDLSETNAKLEEVLSEVRRLAITDPLTGLFNRRHFTSMLEKEFSRVRRYKSELGCLIIDIDYFKKINDTLGHHAGDTVLSEVSGIFTAGLRKADIICRWGGEEFVVLLPQTGPQMTHEVAERLRLAVQEYRFLKHPELKVTVSIGASTWPAEGMDSPDTIINTADEALYRAKNAGRNRVMMSGE